MNAAIEVLEVIVRNPTAQEAAGADDRHPARCQDTREDHHVAM
ncbi:MAG: hypothetical protein ABR606_08400 [Vicinamibacterales bacterium]